MGTERLQFRFPCVPGHPCVPMRVQAPFQCPCVHRHLSGSHVCRGTFPVPISTREPFRCPFVPGNHSSAHVCPGTIPVSMCARAPFRCPCVSRHHSSVHVCPGTIPVPMCARAPFRCPCVPGHPSGAHACQAPFRFPSVPGYRKASWAHMDTGRVPGQTWAPRKVPGHTWEPEGCLTRMGTMCARAPFRCPSLPGTLPVPKCARVHFGVPMSVRELFRCLCVPGKPFGTRAH